jgi:hypothetical protein
MAYIDATFHQYPGHRSRLKSEYRRSVSGLWESLGTDEACNDWYPTGMESKRHASISDLLWVLLNDLLSGEQFRWYDTDPIGMRESMQRKQPSVKETITKFRKTEVALAARADHGPGMFVYETQVVHLTPEEYCHEQPSPALRCSLPYRFPQVAYDFVRSGQVARIGLTHFGGHLKIT